MTTSELLELASNLAHTRTFYESGDICDNEDDMYEDITAETTVYKDEIQDRFHTWYDFYLTEIKEVVTITDEI
jgi:hypothetical protein